MSIPYEKLFILKTGLKEEAPVSRQPLHLGTKCVVDPPIVLAPMAAVTNAPYRKLCREMGAGLVVTEMVYAELLIHQAKKSCVLLDLREDESPVCVQLYGKKPKMLAQAAQICEDAGADAVDLNMGCPMRKVVASGHGAALLRDPAHVERIYQAMSAAVSIPVTAKIRAGWQDVNAVDVARAIENGGGAAVTIHGRTRCEKYDGHADLDVIRELKSAITIPVIGNGDVHDYNSARRMFTRTNCDAVMVARGCLGNPWIFSEIADDLQGIPMSQMYNPIRLLTTPSDTNPLTCEEVAQLKRHAQCTIMRHIDLYIETFGIEITSKQIRKHLVWYFRETTAEKMIRSRLRGLSTREEMLEAVEETLSVL